MPRMTRRVGHLLTVTTLLTQIVLASQASPNAPSPAPFPAPILSAKKVFIANAPGDNLPDSLGGPDRLYNDFYVATKNWGRYEVVSTPQDADIVLAISFTSSLSDVGGTSSSGPLSSTSQYLRLAILDAKTGVPLWWFAQPFSRKFSFGHHPETLEAAFSRSLASLMDNFKKRVGTGTDGT